MNEENCAINDDDSSMAKKACSTSTPMNSTSKKRPQCSKCLRTFAKRCNLLKHVERNVCSAENKKVCTARGRLNQTLLTGFSCPSCNELFPSSHILSAHKLSHTYPTEEYKTENACLTLKHVSLSGVVRDYVMESTNAIIDIKQFVDENRAVIDSMMQTLNEFLLKGLKYVHVTYNKVDRTTDEVVQIINTHFPSAPADEIFDLDKWMKRHVDYLNMKIDEFNDNDSDLIFSSIQSLTFKMNLTSNHGGSGKFVLPKTLLEKKAVVNVDCETECFKYAVLSMLHYSDIDDHRNRPSKYVQWRDELDFTGLNANVMNFKDIEKFERMNNIKIVVHLWEGGLKGVRYNERASVYDRVVNILLVYNDSNPEWHYCGIPKISRLYQHLEKYNASKFYCDRCPRYFTSQKKLEVHYQSCLRGKLQMEKMPDDILFKFHEKGEELSPTCVIYADIECYIEPKTNIHKPAAISCREVWFTGKEGKTQLWEGEGCIIQFLKYLEKKTVSLQRREVEMTRRKMIYTEEDKINFDNCHECPKCKEKFDDETKKVRDHCHLTGKFRSALCQKCNFLHRLRRRNLPVIFHNLKGYDSHLLIKNGMGKMKCWELEVIAQTKEKYSCIMAKVPVDKTSEGKLITFTIKFLDSFEFMASSLASLVNNLESLPETQKLKKEYPKLSDATITRKGVFPYSYFTSMNVLNETKLPCIDKFRNDLTGDDCSPEDYEYALKAWDEFECETLGDYMTAYLKLDVYLLSDVFETFRKKALSEDQLDPVHFFSLPHMSYTSAFKMTRETIHLLDDYEMFTLFERGIRGGLTGVNKHHVKARKCDGFYSILQYYDQNNLYGSALSQYLPHSNFKWVEEEQLRQFENADNILSLGDYDSTGYVFDIDLIYPDEIKDATKDFPLAPESDYVTEEMFSPFMKRFYELLNNQPSSRFKSHRKLLLNQFDKENYVVHYRLLKFYLEMGMKIKKINCAIQFTQKPFLKPYIDYNSKKRANAKNPFEKDYNKLKNNALFGKTMENVRKRMKFKLITDAERAEKLMRSPLFMDHVFIDEDICGMKLFKDSVLLSKPIYIGQAVLDFSKLEMYHLYYKILKTCPLIHDVELLGGDTDSFQLRFIMNEKIHFDEVKKYLRPYFDSSNYPTDHPLFSNENKAKLGCFKDECAGREIEEMILLRPKMYSIKFKDSSDSIKRAKGISKRVVKNMKHKQYRDAYKHMKLTKVSMTILKSKDQEIRTTTFEKRALSAWEDKRCWISKNHSLPHGHHDTNIPPPKKRKLTLPLSGDVVE